MLFRQFLNKHEDSGQYDPYIIPSEEILTLQVW